MNKIVKLIKKFQDTIYDRHQGDSGPKMFDGCNKIVNTFLKQGEFNSGGRRIGRCGYKKDHKRSYCCETCFRKLFQSL